ncbi:hypothetical protein OCU04_007714 [Sclerotinia nivalis]|uniref:LAGLIDADG endonuclease n=1 Tax=Sclerotinia nivalis TaxID=352851 RepID=A0A9X0DI74_9HELO|nr:hypothetical protein OCU04_007714 [Sclerotinia nivalis]
MFPQSPLFDRFILGCNLFLSWLSGLLCIDGSTSSCFGIFFREKYHIQRRHPLERAHHFKVHITLNKAILKPAQGKYMSFSTPFCKSLVAFFSTFISNSTHFEPQFQSFSLDQ